jgi:formate-dependent nitrite reductase membrane component NrfD
VIAAAEHFVESPHWEWYIVGYFFLAGIAGGSYLLGTMLRLWGGRADEHAARLAFLISFPALLLCPILLTLDLGQPGRFWHMLIDDSPGGRLVFKYWSPMSLGAWGLTIFGAFSFVSFVEALVLDGRIKLGILKGAFAALERTVGTAFNILGSVLAVFVASYTGVLLSVSNQPVWSDTWALGGLFLASSLSGSAALLFLLVHYRREARGSAERIARVDTYFVLLEVVLIGALLATVASAGWFTQLAGGKWAALWVVVGVAIVAALAVHYRVPLVRRTSPLLVAALTIAGVWVLRTVVVFSAQS